MNKIWSIRDEITGAFVKDTDLHNRANNIMGTNSPVDLYFHSLEHAEKRLEKLRKALLKESYETADWFKIKPQSNRFKIVEGKIKVLTKLNTGCFYRIKDTKTNTYYLKGGKFHETGRIYKSLSGVEPVVTRLTKTPKVNRTTKAKKMLFGKPESFGIEIEPCSLEFI